MTQSCFPELAPQFRVLMGPGPSNVHPRVFQAMLSPILGHLDPQFFSIMETVTKMLRVVFQTQSDMTFPLSGTGTAGMEAAMLNLLEPGDTAVIGVSGFFGDRLVQIAQRSGAKIVVVSSQWGRPLDMEAVERELQRHPKVKLLGVVHGETSTGVKQPLEEPSRLAKQYDAMFVVDAVATLGGCNVAVDEWGIDFCFSATQKCLSAPPALSPITFSETAGRAIDRRKEKVRSFYVDLALLREYWASTKARLYHHTAPISSIYGLYEALRLIVEEGLEARFQRHALNAAALRSGLEALGLKLLAPEGYRMDQLTAVVIPEGVDDVRVRGRLLQDYSIEIGGGFGLLKGRIWRIGLMGESCCAANVLNLLAALERLLPQDGFGLPQGAGVAAASRVLARSEA